MRESEREREERGERGEREREREGERGERGEREREREGERGEREREGGAHMLDPGHSVTKVVVVRMVFGGDGKQLHQQSMVVIDPLDLLTTTTVARSSL